jgi:hypothetical protein
MAKRRPGGQRLTHEERLERFHKKYEVDPDTGCWVWTGAKSHGGYGKLCAGGVGNYMGAHRWAYIHLVGPIPDGLHLDHLCRNPPCVNPAHLEPVTCRENLLRGVGPSAQHAAKTHCPQGHAYDEANTYVKPRTGIRVCRACNRQRDRERASRRRDQERAANADLALIADTLGDLGGWRTGREVTEALAAQHGGTSPIVPLVMGRKFLAAENAGLIRRDRPGPSTSTNPLRWTTATT